jgi:hypothetical protein
MPTQPTNAFEYIRQTKSYMEELKAAVRSSPNFAGLSGQVELEHRLGPEHARGSVYRSKWELQGTHGMLAVEASFANDFGCSVVTRLALKPLGTASAEAVFGQERVLTSSTENVAPIIKSWIDIISNAPVDPFAGAKMPPAS